MSVNYLLTFLLTHFSCRPSVFGFSDVSDDLVLHVMELMLRLSTLSTGVQTTTRQILLVSFLLVVLFDVIFVFFPYYFSVL